MPTYTLRFERYEQMQALVDIEADDLDEAIAKAWLIDAPALDWQKDDEAQPTDPRLYEIKDKQGDALVKVQTPIWTWSFAWTHVDLRHQWKRLGSAPTTRALVNDIQDVHDALERFDNRLRPSMEASVQADVLRCRLEAATPAAHGEKRSGRL